MAQKIIFAGPVEMDMPLYGFAPGSEIVVLSGDIQVPSGKLLMLSNTHVHGCTNLWRGITVSGVLQSTNNSVIEDANTGIELRHGAKLTCVSTSFIGNYIGIYAHDGKMGAIQISGCIFSGAKNLLSTPIVGHQLG